MVLKMEWLKNKISYFKSEKGKRVLKLSLMFGVAAAVLVGGLYMYVSHINKVSYEKYVKAQDLYLQAIREDEKKEGSLKKAAELFEEVISQRLWFGNKEEALFYLADCLYRSGSLEESVQTLEKFKEDYPSSYFSPWVQLKLALIYEQMGSYQQAINLYERIKKEHAQTSVAPEAFLGQARCQELLHSKEEAFKTYQRLISRYPLSPQAEIADVKLQHFSQKKG